MIYWPISSLMLYLVASGAPQEGPTGAADPQEAATRETVSEEGPSQEPPSEGQSRSDLPQKVEVIRFSDKVMVREGITGKETVLLYPNKFALLQEGDEVVQGSQGRSECRFQNRSRIMFFGRNRYRFGTLVQDTHIVKVDEFSRLNATVKEDLILNLPGGTRLEATYCDCYLQLEGNLIRIRNAGPLEIKLQGHLVKEEHEVVPPGHSISIPLYDPELSEEMEPIVVREVAGMIIKTTGGYRLEEKPGFLVISRPTVDEGIARIGGSRIYLYPGEKVIFRFP